MTMSQGFYLASSDADNLDILLIGLYRMQVAYGSQGVSANLSMLQQILNLAEAGAM